MKSKKRKSSCLYENDCDKENTNSTTSSLSAIPPCLSLGKAIPPTSEEPSMAQERIAPASYLLDLPPSLLFYILSFTSFTDIAFLDTAFCSRYH